MEMRISAGKLKGRRVSSVKALKLVKKHGELRPTSSKVKAAIFNILGERIRDSRFIDLYAGTGAVGIEAISRGAQTVFFVESDKKRIDLIEEALKKYNCIEKAHVIRQNASDFVKNALKNGLKADIIFLDPPYHSSELDNILSLLSDGELLSDDGIAIAEHLSKKKLPNEIGGLRQKKSYKYGDTMLTLFRKV